LSYQLDMVEKQIDGHAVTCSPCVTTDPTGSLVMVYGSYEGLMIAKEENGVWTAMPIMCTGVEGVEFSVRAVSVAVGSDGLSHVASISLWYDGTEIVSRLTYSEETSGNWESTTICDGVSTRGVSIAVDADANSHISFSSLTDWSGVVNLTYATDSSGEWTSYDISAKADMPKWFDLVLSSVVVDGAGNPHLSFITEYLSGYISNPAGEPVCQIVGWGNPWMSGVCPSYASIAVDSDDTVHVLAFSEYQADFDSPCVTTLSHYVVEDGVGSLENHTVTAQTDFSWALTRAAIDSEGRLCLFYLVDHEMGVARLNGDDEVSIETIYVIDKEVRNIWWSDLSVVLLDDGETVVSKPYGSAGYLTSSFSLSDRIYFATAPVQQTLVLLAVVACLLSLAVILSRRAVITEEKWQRAIDGSEEDAPPT